MADDIAVIGIRADTSALKTAERDLDKFGAAAARVEGEVREIPPAADKATKATKEMGKAAGGAAKAIEKANQKLSGMGKAGALLGRVLSSGTVALAGLAASAASLQRAVETIKEFEGSMGRLAGISQATGRDLKALRDAAKEAGATTAFSATQAAGGLTYLAQAGFSARDAVKALPHTLNLATAAQMDLAQAADIASNIMSAFSISADQSERAMDVITAASISANTNVSQLGIAMKYIGPVASAVGISIEQTAAAIGTLSDAGMQGEQAGTALRNIMGRLIRPTGEVKKVMDALGLSAADLSPQTNTLAQIFAKLEAAGMSATDAMRMFGMEGASASLVLAGANDRIAELTDKLNAADGTARKVAETVGDNLKGDVVALGSAIEGLAIALGDAGLTAILRGLTKLITAVVRALTALLDLIPRAVEGFSRLFQKMTSFGMVTKYEYADALEIAKEATEANRRAVDGLKESLSSGEVLTRQAAMDKLALARATREDTKATLENIRAKTMQSKEWRHHQSVIDAANSEIERVRDIAKDVSESIDEATQSQEEIAAIWAEVNSQLADAQGLLNRATAAQQEMLTPVKEAEKAWRDAESVVDELWQRIRRSQGETVNLGRETGGVLVKATQLAATFSAMGGKVGTVTGEVDDLSSSLSGAAKNAFELARGLASIVATFGGVAQALENAYNSVSDATDGFGLLGEAAGTIGENVSNVMAPALKSLAGPLRDTAARLRMQYETYQGMPRALKETALGLSGDDSGGGGKSIKSAADEATDALDGTLVKLRTLEEVLRDEMVRAVDSFSNAWAEFVVGGFKDFRGFVSSVKDAFKNLLVELITQATRNRILISLGVTNQSGPQYLGGGTGTGGIFQSLLGLGSGVGNALSSAGGILGGIGKFVSTIAPIVTAISVVGAIFSAFRTRKKKVGSGFALGVTGGGKATGGLIDVIKKSNIFGSSQYEKFEEFGPELQKSLNNQVKNVQETVFNVYREAGVKVSDSMAEGVKLATEKLNTTGMGEEEIQQWIIDRLGRYGENLSKAIGGVGIAAVAAFVDIQNMLAPVGMKFKKFSANAANASAALIEAAGGLDNLQNAISAYYQNFWTDSEKLKDAQKASVRVFREHSKTLGLTAKQIRKIDTHKEFRKLVDGLDLTTKSGREAFGALMSVQGAFDAFADSVAETKEEAKLARIAMRELAAEMRSARADMVLELSGPGRQENILSNRMKATFKDIFKMIPKDMKSLRNLFKKPPKDATDFIKALNALKIKSGGGKKNELFRSIFTALQESFPDFQQLLQLQERNSDKPGSTAGTGRVSTRELIASARDTRRNTLLSLANDSQRTSLLTAQVAGAFRSVGKSVPKTLEGFYKLISGLDLSKKKARDMLDTLSEVAPAFAEIKNAAKEAIEAAKNLRTDTLLTLANDTQRRGILSAQVNAAFRSVGRAVPKTAAAFFNMVRGLNVTTKKGRETLSVLSEIAPAFMELQEKGSDWVNPFRDLGSALRDSATEAQRLASAWGGINERVTEFVAAYRASASGSRNIFTRAAINQTAFNTAARKAIGGDLDAAGDVTGAASDYLSSIRATSRTYAEYRSRAAAVINKLGEVASAAEGQETIQEKAVSLAEKQLSRLEAIEAALTNGNVNISALRAFAQALGPSLSATFSAFLDTLEASGFTVPKVAGYAGGGMHLGGLRVVGEQGPELEATGPARYYSAKKTGSLLEGMGGGAMAKEIRELRREVKAMREEQRSIGISTVRVLTKDYNISKKWDNIGLPPEQTA